MSHRSGWYKFHSQVTGNRNRGVRAQNEDTVSQRKTGCFGKFQELLPAMEDDKMTTVTWKN